MYSVCPYMKFCVLRISLPTKYNSSHPKKVVEREIVHMINTFNKYHISTAIGSELLHPLAPPLFLEFSLLKIGPSHEVKQV